MEEGLAEINFDMSMPLTKAEEQHVATLAADDELPQVWVLFFQICPCGFHCQRSWPSLV